MRTMSNVFAVKMTRRSATPGTSPNRVQTVSRVANTNSSRTTIAHFTFDHLSFTIFAPVVPGAASEEGIKERTTAKESANQTPVLVPRTECVGWPRPGAVYYMIYYRTYTTWSSGNRLVSIPGVNKLLLNRVGLACLSVWISTRPGGLLIGLELCLVARLHKNPVPQF